MPVSDPLTSLVTNPNLIVVVRDFSGGGAERFRGELVDTDGWTNTPVLVARRYASAVPYGYDMDSTVTVKIDGEDRRFTSTEFADRAQSLAAPAVTDSAPVEEEQHLAGEPEQSAEDDQDELEEAPAPQPAPRATNRSRSKR